MWLIVSSRDEILDGCETYPEAKRLVRYYGREGYCRLKIIKSDEKPLKFS